LNYTRTRLDSRACGGAFKHRPVGPELASSTY